jgi:hypothetical protein
MKNYGISTVKLLLYKTSRVCGNEKLIAAISWITSYLGRRNPNVKLFLTPINNDCKK